MGVEVATHIAIVNTEYGRAKVPPYSGNDSPPSRDGLKRLLFLPQLNKVQNKGTQGVRARHDAELPPFISIVRHLCCPVILGMDNLANSELPLPHGLAPSETIVRDHHLSSPLSTVNPINERFSVSGAPFCWIWSRRPRAQGVGVEPCLVSNCQ